MLADLVDVWEAANRDDLFSVTSLKHFPYIANSDFHRPRHLYSWKTLVRARKEWTAIKSALRDNVNIAITLYRGGPWTVSRGASRPNPPSSTASAGSSCRMGCSGRPAAVCGRC